MTDARLVLACGAAMLALAALSGCGGPAPVSLEEAKRVTAEFTAPPETAPPEAEEDESAILDFQPAEASAERRQAADAEPPNTTDPDRLAEFYLERGKARRLANRLADSVKDLREAQHYAASGRRADRADIAFQLAQSLQWTGQRRPENAAIKEAIALTPPRRLGRVAHYDFVLATSSIALGRIEEARQASAAMQDAVAKAEENVRNPALAAALPRLRILALRAQSAVARADGNLAKAETLERQLASDAENNAEFREDGWSGNMRVGLADVLLAEGKVGEAEAQARRAIGEIQRAPGASHAWLRRAVASMSAVLDAEGRYAESEAMARRSVELQRSAGTSGNGGAQWPVARALVAQRRWAEALQIYDDVAKFYRVKDSERAGYYAKNFDWLLALIEAGRIDEALASATASVAYYDRPNANPRLVALAHGFLGLAYTASGNHARALAEYGRAAPVLIAATTAADESEDSFGDRHVTAILDGYLKSLAATQAEAGHAARAFEIAQAAAGRTVQRAVSEASGRMATSDPELADLARREQDARRRIDALERLLGNSALTDPDGPEVQKLNADIASLKAARATIVATLRSRFPAYLSLLQGQPVTPDEAAQKLAADEALLLFRVTGDQTYVWSVGNGRPLAFAAVKLGRADLAAMVSDLRRSLAPQVSTLGDIPPFDVDLANRLYAELLGPVAANWQDAKRLDVVADGALGELPLSLLVTEKTDRPVDRKGEALFSSYQRVPFLIRKASETRFPSVASLVTLRSLPAPHAGRRAFAGFGDPWFNAAQAAEGRVQDAALERSDTQVASRGAVRLRSTPKSANYSAELADLPRLPDTAEEVREVAAALHADPPRDVFLGDRATEHQVATMRLDDRRVIMFATHGLVPGDLKGLNQPALALTAPQLAGLPPGSGLLTMDEIMALKLDADWVVLSACNTAAGEGKGSEAVSGLGRAFFYAGARALLVTNWPVESRSARLLTTELFRRQAANPSLPRAEALRQTEIGLIDGPGYVDAQGHPVFSYAHPIFWAPYSLIGDGG